MTEKVKTCVYAISLNEEKFTESFMKGASEADCVVVGDTGSTDNTVNSLRDLGADVYIVKQKPWRFDVPRNSVMSLIPGDIDLCVSVDLDEQMQPGWTDAIDEKWHETNKQLTRGTFDFIWGFHPDGVTPAVRFMHDKIHKRHGYVWRHPCHETLYWQGPGPELVIPVPKMQIQHRPDPSKSRGFYIDLLKLAVTEDPHNDRMCHYYARELHYYGKNEESINEFRRHLSLPAAQWKEERCASYRYMSRCYRSMGDLKESQHQALLGTREWPFSREPWLEYARAAYHNQDWQACYEAASRCLAITEPTRSYTGDTACWGWEPYDLAAISAYNIGHYDKAVEYGQKAIELSPEDSRLINNMRFYNEKHSG